MSICRRSARSRRRLIEYSARQLAADIAVYTNIGVSHIESYGGQGSADRADKLSLSTFGKPDGLAIINYDDPILMGHRLPNRSSLTASNPQAMYYAKNILVRTTATFTLVDRAAAEGASGANPRARRAIFSTPSSPLRSARL